MPRYRLHCFGESGNAYKPALYLARSGADWEPVWVNFFEGQHRSAEFVAMNEYGQVPVLEDGDLRLSQSGLILQHLQEQIGKFAPKDEAERREVMRWLLWDNYSFTSVLAPFRFIGHFTPPEKRDAGVLAFLGARMKNALKVLDRRLAGRDWVAASGPTIADFSIAGYLYYGDELPFDLNEYPNIVRWLDRLKALPGWKGPYDLMPRKPA